VSTPPPRPTRVGKGLDRHPGAAECVPYRPVVLHHAHCGGPLGPNVQGRRICQTCGGVVEIGGPLDVFVHRSAMRPEVFDQLMLRLMGWGV